MHTQPQARPRRLPALACALAALALLLPCAAAADPGEPPAPSTNAPAPSASAPATPVLLPATAAGHHAISPISPSTLATYEYLAGAGTAMVITPAVMYFGSWLGSLSSNLVGAVLPPLLLLLAVPPVAITLAEWIVDRRLAPGGPRFHPAIWAAVGLNALAVVLGSLGGVWIGDPTSTTLYSLAEALVVPAGVALVLWLKRRPKAPRPAALAPAAPPVLPETPRPALIPHAPAIVVPIVAFTF